MERCVGFIDKGLDERNRRRCEKEIEKEKNEEEGKKRKKSERKKKKTLCDHLIAISDSTGAHPETRVNKKLPFK